jgi:Fic family protein
MLQFPLRTPIEPLNELVTQVVALATALSYLPLTTAQQVQIFHQEFLRSSLFSARIEGNQLTLNQTKHLDLENPREKSALEISNVLKTLQRLPQHSTTVTLNDVKTFHSQILAGLHGDAGKLRHESSAIYDQYGNVVYLTPEPTEMKTMLKEWLAQVNQPPTQVGQQLAHVACLPLLL